MTGTSGTANGRRWRSSWPNAPAQALTDGDDLVDRMLSERGYAIDDPIAREGDDREFITEFLAARRITRLVEQESDDVSPGDVGAALNGYRATFDYLIAERSAP